MDIHTNHSRQKSGGNHTNQSDNERRSHQTCTAVRSSSRGSRRRSRRTAAGSARCSCSSTSTSSSVAGASASSISLPLNNIDLSTGITRHEHSALSIKRQADGPETVARTSAVVHVGEDGCQGGVAVCWRSWLAVGAKCYSADQVPDGVCAIPGTVHGDPGNGCGVVEFDVEWSLVCGKGQARWSGACAERVVGAGLGKGSADGDVGGVERSRVPGSEAVRVAKVCALVWRGGAVEVAEEVELFAGVVCILV